MGNWKIIEPEATTNLIPNPSFETGTTDWSGPGANTIAQTSARSKWGAYSLKCTYQNNPTLAQISLTLTAAAHAFSAWVFLGTSWDGGAIELAVGNFTAVSIDTVTTSTTELGKWVRLEILFTPDAGDLTGDLRVNNASAPTAGRFIYIDGIQCEAKAYTTTYGDGSRDGWKWNFSPHASTSTRDATESTGGRIRDMADDFGFAPEVMDGVGKSQVVNQIVPKGFSDGATFLGQRDDQRRFVLRGTLSGSTMEDFHDKRQALLKVLDARTVGANETPVPRRFRYTGAAVDKEIDAVYSSGLGLSGPSGFTEQGIPLQLIAVDPAWRQVGDSAKVLDTEDSFTIPRVAGRIDGLWDDLGPPSSFSTVYALLFHEGILYVGGDFLNWDGIANADYIVSWNGTAWSALSTGMDGIVRALAVSPDGTIYAGGDFANAAAVLSRGIASWDGTNWSALGPPASGGDVYALAFGTDGTLFVGGDFLNWDGDANGDFVTSWDGSAWNALSTGLTDIIRTMVVNESGILFVAGDTLAVNSWDGSSFTNIGTHNNIVYDVVIDTSGELYACGSFTTMGSVSVDRISKWNGSLWSKLNSVSDLANGTPFAMTFMPDSTLYVGGDHLTSGGITTRFLSRWSGSDWLPADIRIDSNDILAVINNGDDLYIGGSISGTAFFSGNVSVNYAGTNRTHPVITIKRTGGDVARILSLINITTNAELSLDYSLLDGESLIIDLRPGRRSITSSFFGSRWSAVFDSSDISSLFLESDNTDSERTNTVTSFVREAGSPTVEAYMVWQDSYQSID